MLVILKVFCEIFPVQGTRWPVLAQRTFIEACIVNELEPNKESSKSAWYRRICGWARVIVYADMNNYAFWKPSP